MSDPLEKERALALLIDDLCLEKTQGDPTLSVRALARVIAGIMQGQTSDTEAEFLAASARISHRAMRGIGRDEKVGHAIAGCAAAIVFFTEGGTRQ